MRCKGRVATRGATIGIAFRLYSRANKVGSTGLCKDDFRAWTVLLDVLASAVEGSSSSYQKSERVSDKNRLMRSSMELEKIYLTSFPYHIR